MTGRFFESSLHDLQLVTQEVQFSAEVSDLAAHLLLTKLGIVNRLFVDEVETLLLELLLLVHDEQQAIFSLLQAQ